MHLVAAQRRDLQERRAAIEDQGEAIARQQLAALVELFLRARGGLGNPALKRPKFIDQREVMLAVGGEGIRARVDFGFEWGHANAGLKNSVEALWPHP